MFPFHCTYVEIFASKVTPQGTQTKTKSQPNTHTKNVTCSEFPSLTTSFHVALPPPSHCYIMLPGFTFLIIVNSVCNYLDHQFHFICLFLYLLFFVYLPSPLDVCSIRGTGWLIHTVFNLLKEKKKPSNKDLLTVQHRELYSISCNNL